MVRRFRRGFVVAVPAEAGAEEPEKKPGLLKRWFGKKEPPDGGDVPT